MPIKVHLHNDQCLRVYKICGAINPAHFRALGEFYAVRSDLLAHDLISLVADDVAVSSFTADDPVELRASFRALQVNADLMVQRRAAWICPSVVAWPLLETWLEGRHARDGQGTEFCLVARLEDAKILFDARELDAVMRWTGFREIAEIEA